jgi:hypothetical protein
MRSGGKGMWGRGPALYKHNYYYLNDKYWSRTVVIDVLFSFYLAAWCCKHNENLENVIIGAACSTISHGGLSC